MSHINKRLNEIRVQDLPTSAGFLYACFTPTISQVKRTKFRLEDTIKEYEYTHYYKGTILSYSGNYEFVELYGTRFRPNWKYITEQSQAFVLSWHDRMVLKKTPGDAARRVYEFLAGEINTYKGHIATAERKIEDKQKHIDLIKSKSIYT